MKTIKSLLLVLALTVVTVSLNAQFSISGETGYSSKKGLAVGFNLGYDFKAVNVETGLLSHTSQAVDKGAIFYAKLGKSILIRDEQLLIPSIGYGYVMRSADDKSLNTSGVLYSLYYVKSIRDGANWTLGVTYCDKTVIAAIGMRLTFGE